MYFHDCFARLADLPIQEFHNYLANFPRLQEPEMASCERLITECKVCDVLKQVSLNKLPGLDGLLYEVYLSMSQMFAHILMDMFNHWFAQGAIPGNITKGVDHITEERWQACLGGLR